MVDVPLDAGAQTTFSVPVVGFASFGGEASALQLAFENFAVSDPAPSVTPLWQPPSARWVSTDGRHETIRASHDATGPIGTAPISNRIVCTLHLVSDTSRCLGWGTG
jgi:hypothetical protein